MARKIQGKEPIRMGPVSIFALVIILCLSVMAVLAVATAHASVQEVHKQSETVTGTYAVEAAGQSFVAEVDATLSQAKQKNLSLDQTMQLLGTELPAEAVIDKSTVSISYANPQGRTLSIRLVIKPDYTYNTELWRISTVRNYAENQGGTLWNG